MSGLVKSYDPKKVIITFKGTPISGFADGTFIQIAFASDTWTKSVGADGEVARGLSNDATAEITLTLMQTSPSNTNLSTIATQDRLFGTGVGEFSMTDLYGNALVFFSQGWIKKNPDVERAKELSNVAWVFETGQVDVFNLNGDYV